MSARWSWNICSRWQNRRRWVLVYSLHYAYISRYKYKYDRTKFFFTNIIAVNGITWKILISRHEWRICYVFCCFRIANRLLRAEGGARLSKTFKVRLPDANYFSRQIKHFSRIFDYAKQSIPFLFSTLRSYSFFFEQCDNFNNKQ